MSGFQKKEIANNPRKPSPKRGWDYKKGINKSKSSPNNNANYAKKDHYQEDTWISNNYETLTLQDCLAKWHGQDEIIQGINILIKRIHLSGNLFNILEALWTGGHWPVNVKMGKFKGYNPLHEANFISSECDHETIIKVYRLLHTVGYDVFAVNVYKENAFESLSKCHFVKNRITEIEYHYRHEILAKITTEQINKIVTSIFNKVDNINSTMIDRLHYVMFVDLDVVLTKIAEILITRRIPDSLCALNKKKEGKELKRIYVNDRTVNNYIIAILKVFSGADSNFEGFELIDKSLELFFKHNKVKLPGLNKLLKMLWEKCIECIFTNERDNKDLNPESLSIVIGAFANANALIDEYNNFMEQCLMENSLGIFVNFEYELRIKMAIRSLNQSRRFTPIIKEKFKNLLQINNLISAAIQNLLDSELTEPMQLDSKQFKEESIVFFKEPNLRDLKASSDTNEREFFIKITMESFDDTLAKYSNKRLEIIKKLIICLVENFHREIDLDFIDNIFKELTKKVSYKEIIKTIKYIENTDFLSELKIDAPYSEVVWKTIIDFIFT